jgi:hypothetical protein
MAAGQIKKTMSRESRKRLYRDKVLLAIYSLADGEGRVCTATYAKIAAAAGGMHPDTVKWYVSCLHCEGMLVEFNPCQYKVGRVTLVLGDHPEAGAIVAWLEKLRRPSRPYRHGTGVEVERPWLVRP